MGTKTQTKEALAADLINCIPTNWCDPLLTGDSKVLPDGYSYTPQDVERRMLRTCLLPSASVWRKRQAFNAMLMCAVPRTDAEQN